MLFGLAGNASALTSTTPDGSCDHLASVAQVSGAYLLAVWGLVMVFGFE